MSFAVQRYLKRRFPLSRRAPAEDDTFFSFASGTFIHLDGGTLDLGIVRDSMVTMTNNFQVFGQTFEKVAADFKKLSEVISTTNVLDDFKRANSEWGSGPYGDQES